MKTYQELIQTILNEIGGGEFTIDPRHIEGFMRLQHSTLDGLSITQFKNEVLLCVDCVKAVSLVESEQLALSYNL